MEELFSEHIKDIEIIPGSPNNKFKCDSDRFATVHRMQTLGSMIERINTKFWIQTNSVHNFRNTLD